MVNKICSCTALSQASPSRDVGWAGLKPDISELASGSLAKHPIPDSSFLHETTELLLLHKRSAFALLMSIVYIHTPFLIASLFAIPS